MVNLTQEPGESDAEQMLERCEVALYAGLRREMEAGAVVGAQLQKIRENQLYRAAECKTFETYCRQYLEMSREAVDRFLVIHEVVETLANAGLQLPFGETQTHLLSKIPRDRWEGFWRTVLSYCAREEMVPSDGMVRRGVRFELARTRSSEKSVPPRESVAGEAAGVPCNGEDGQGVEVDLEL